MEFLWEVFVGVGESPRLWIEIPSQALQPVQILAWWWLVLSGPRLVDSRSDETGEKGIGAVCFASSRGVRVNELVGPILSPAQLGELGLLCWEHSEGKVEYIGPRLRSAIAECGLITDQISELAHGVDYDAMGVAYGELLPGVPVVVTGWGSLMLAALPEGFARSEEAEAWIGASGLTRDSFAQSVEGLCVHPRATCERVLRAASWAVGSERLFRDSQRALAGYTVELAGAYDTIDFMYVQGRSMQSVRRPDRFIQDMCDGLCRAGRLGWSVVSLLPGRLASVSIEQSLFVAGELPLSRDRVSASAARVASHQTIRKRARVLESGAWGEHSAGRQIVARVVDVAGVPSAVVFGGNDTGRPSSHEIELLDASAGLLGAFLSITSLWSAEHQQVTNTLEALTRAIDAKDPYTLGHSVRVSWLSERIALEAGLGDEFAERSKLAGLVHDIGKIGIAEAVLCKPGRLSADEYEEIKRHPEIGFRILERLPFLEEIRPAVLSHHERWDGKGYPHGLRGESIPLLARVVGLADTFDAMSSNRSYRPAMSREQVLSEVRSCAGTQLDASLVRAFERVDLSEYDEMLEAHASQRVVEEERPAA